MGVDREGDLRPARLARRNIRGHAEHLQAHAEALTSTENTAARRLRRRAATPNQNPNPI